MEDNLGRSPNGTLDNLEDYIRKTKRQHTKSDQVEDIKYNQTKKGTNDYNEHKLQTGNWNKWESEKLEDAAALQIIIIAKPPAKSKSNAPKHKHNSTQTHMVKTLHTSSSSAMANKKCFRCYIIMSFH